MNKLELVDHIATKAELTKVSAAAALEAVLEGIEKTLKKGEEVRLVGFGTFSVRERAAGKGRNPATGKEIKIAASKNARFKPGAALKASLNKKAAQEIAPSGRATKAGRPEGRPAAFGDSALRLRSCYACWRASEAVICAPTTCVPRKKGG